MSTLRFSLFNLSISFPRIATTWFVVFVVVLPSVVGAEDAEKDEAPPDPVVEVLTTKDQVSLNCTFYPGTNGKETVPIVMVHGWKGVRGEFDRIARYLQSLGHAVMVPDLRGHGESTQRRTLNGENQIINPDRMKPAQIAGMYEFDLEAVKTFLLKKNNDGELNIEMLTLVGSEMGTIVAMNWAVIDWSWPQLPTLKQGQDVKALVLISPILASKGLKIQLALRNPNVRSLPTLIMVGKQNRRSNTDAKKLHSRLKRYHLPESKDPKEANRKQSLFFADFDTSLKGTKLIEARVEHKNYSPYQWIGGVIHLRLVQQQASYPWRDRSRK